MWKFVHDSDIHYGWRGVAPRDRKISNPITISERDDVDFVIVTGDLTENGYDGSYVNLGLFKYHCGGYYNQLKALKEKYVERIENSGKPVYLCNGNHDYGEVNFWVWHCAPVHEYIKSRRGSLLYTFKHKGVKFICCGMYPNNMEWLEKQLEDVDEPTIIYFHFNLMRKWSHWWSLDEKDLFYKTIRHYNIIAILTGHHHTNYVGKWRGIRTIVSGNEYAIISYDPSKRDIVDIKRSEFTQYDGEKG